jgi:hypothetical protein
VELANLVTFNEGSQFGHVQSAETVELEMWRGSDMRNREVRSVSLLCYTTYLQLASSGQHLNHDLPPLTFSEKGVSGGEMDSRHGERDKQQATKLTCKIN